VTCDVDPRPERTPAKRAVRLLRDPRLLVPAIRRRARSTPWSPPVESRLAVITKDLPLDGLGLEIGPSHNPLLPKSAGYNIRTADHLDQDGLIAKYGSYKSTANIEFVDYVIGSGRLTESVDDRFDYIVASHVMEHTVCLVSFLQDCEALLKPGGVLSLALPDKRYCFDRFRERSSLGRVVDVFRLDLPVHTEGSVLEHNLFNVDREGKGYWSKRSSGTFKFRYSKEWARNTAATAVAGEYVDTHNWVMTPHHLRLLLLDLHTLGFIGLREKTFHDTIGHEFFITLSADGVGPGLTREELAVRSATELMSSETLSFG
jgi:SAM-dependent methyltransferase